MNNAHVVEHEGDVLPAYTGVNQPVYHKHDEGLPHMLTTGDSVEESTTVTVSGLSTSDAFEGDMRPDYFEPGKDRIPTPTDRHIGRAGVAGFRQALGRTSK